MSSPIYKTIEKQFQNRIHRINIPALKINLYKNYEVYAVKDAIEQIRGFRNFRIPDCFMVGDSMLTTHLQRSNTRLSSIEGQELFLNFILTSIAEVKAAIKDCFKLSPQPYLMGDIPFGSTKSAKRLLQISETMLKYGADVVKLEIATSREAKFIELLTKHNIPVAAHIGFTPQTSENRRYGNSVKECIFLIQLAQKVRDYGACVLIVERVCETINQALCTPSNYALPVYSIFSGKAKYGGQSLNVWDSVYRPNFKNLYFPSTAKYESHTYPATYTHENIKHCFHNLLKAAFENKFPKSLPITSSQEHVWFIQAIDPWTCSFNPKAKYY